jgi:hypothetical protein
MITNIIGSRDERNNNHWSHEPEIVGSTPTTALIFPIDKTEGAYSRSLTVVCTIATGLEISSLTEKDKAMGTPIHRYTRGGGGEGWGFSLSGNISWYYCIDTKVASFLPILPFNINGDVI